MTRQDFIAGLRELAQVYQDNPQLDIPYGLEGATIYTFSAEDFLRNISVFRNGAKRYQDNSIEFVTDTILGVKVYCPREQVCERRVVGTKRVEERVIPAHDEEIVEWDCRPLLEKRQAAPSIPIAIGTSE